ncbi:MULTISPECIES: HesA/MoeB/ThiF family protein [Deefgea]|uniref:Molybdopterin-synthase adenylyltransferase MoeB n=1 Tax=Deefgea chitinilytica TaxID=570276 RepID=A0ABS2CD01_9NEIS|nr:MULTISPECIES: HesA/MoeB/ThiF family protein [Deefgea]MBM5572029.1 molybdopterin-synthase adenylyltransferase MoeB [Deefgea chitinilytica]MBM9889264.1 HesA/MoeB/ThiF family protein [Deefgea sp. CFH1-16]
MTFCPTRTAQIDLDDAALLRYSRHVLLDEIGIEGQTALCNAHVLIIGAGGLGSPVALYLASAGIGTLTIVDDDAVDLTNLQRQIVHTENRVGQNKAQSAALTLQQLNSQIEVRPFAERASGERLLELVSAADVVVDCCDNFATRHTVNRACVVSKTPLVSGAAVRFDGQLSVFDSRIAGAPCYHCLFDEEGEANDGPCATFGVFAPLVGIIGAAQAAETLKVIMGMGETLIGRLQLFDARSSRWREMKYKQDPHCPVCGNVHAR